MSRQQPGGNWFMWSRQAGIDSLAVHVYTVHLYTTPYSRQPGYFQQTESMRNWWIFYINNRFNIFIVNHDQRTSHS